jgi:hypothetical protein
LAECFLTAGSARSGHIGQPVAQMTPLRTAGASEAKPRRTHCVRTTHVDHLTFVTFLSIRQRYIATCRHTRMGGAFTNRVSTTPRGAAARYPAWCRRHDRDARPCRRRNGRRSCFPGHSSATRSPRGCWSCRGHREIGGDQRTAGINDPGPSADLIPGTQNCRRCGDPIDGPPLTPSCPGPHSKHLEE